jgi:hypothetical protein
MKMSLELISGIFGNKFMGTHCNALAKKQCENASEDFLREN